MAVNEGFGASPGTTPRAVGGISKAPCKSCPYRRDVPSGIWHESEYAKLPGYDGDIIDQLQAGSSGLFMCHQQDGNLCAGWLATHGAENLLAMRMHGGGYGPEAWNYESPVPVFASGAHAAAHGLAEIPAPGPRAARTISRLLRSRAAGTADPQASPGNSA